MAKACNNKKGVRLTTDYTLTQNPNLFLIYVSQGFPLPYRERLLGGSPQSPAVPQSDEINFLLIFKMVHAYLNRYKLLPSGSTLGRIYIKNASGTS